MKSKFPNALADALKKSGLTQRALAELANTTQQQIGRLLHGNREMTAQWAERLAPALSVRPEELLFPNLKRTRVPLFSWVSAGRLASEDGVRKSDVRKYISANDLPKGNWMALEVQGDSMDRVAPDGSIIFVNKDDQRLIDNGFYVFATASGEATFKRYRVGPRPRLQPFSTNPDHETIYLGEDMHVIGRVGRVVTDLI
jgi:SOS-response transcriptional repressor LexA